MHAISLRSLSLLACCSLAACVDASGGDDEAGPQCGVALLGSDADFRLVQRLQLAVDRSVDLLFVVDDTVGMSTAQAKLALASEVLLERFESNPLGVDFRIGITTTDAGNPWCPAGATTPTAGRLVASACTERLGDFVRDDLPLDVQASACTDLCPLEPGALTLAPTTTDVDDTPSARPWFERTRGQTNLPEGITMTDALRCALPQGIGGCGFESPLESMYLALARAGAQDEASRGFVRDGAALAVVLVSDEVDCSYAKDWSDIFDEAGNKVFWSDPSSPVPSSALCWNAGVACTGDPSGYDACDPVNKGIDGTLGVEDAQAVMQPLARYTGYLQNIENAKLSTHPDRDVVVALIGGVEGSGDDWTVSYADATDPQFQLDYGIAPGCVGDDGTIGLPPVRMRDVAETFEQGQMYSICAPDFAPALLDIAEAIEEQLPPACFTGCPLDQDPGTQRLEVHCVVEQSQPGNGYTQVPECTRTLDGYVLDPATGHAQVPDGVDVCYVARTDPDGTHTTDPLDDLHAQCVETNYPLEFVLAYRPGTSVPGGTAFVVECDYSECPEIDCPELGIPG